MPAKSKLLGPTGQCSKKHVMLRFRFCCAFRLNQPTPSTLLVLPPGAAREHETKTQLCKNSARQNSALKIEAAQVRTYEAGDVGVQCAKQKRSM